MPSVMPQTLPAYVVSYEQGLLQAKVEQAYELLGRRGTDGERPICRVCPRGCRVARLADEYGYCRVGRYAAVSSFFPHFGEEACLRGWRGSGTVFFTACNLHCVFCQNWEVSQERQGRTVTPEQLAAIYLKLQDSGCHNLNWVTPEHVVPQALEALLIAVEHGLRLPLIYNTSAYDSPESLQLLDGVVDIYMPDFKFWDPEMSRLYLKAPDYPEVARRTIAEMHRQVGELKLDEFGLARRGVLIRHLVMPGGIAGTREIMNWIARELSVHSYVNIMDQYYPAGLVGTNPRYDAINRRITPQEFAEAVAAARAAGLYRLDVRLRRHPLLRWTPGPDPGPAPAVRVQ